MKRIIPILLAFVILFKGADAQEVQLPRLSETAFGAVLTCGPGDEFYTTFGHSAIRICDTAQGIDVVYNYGVFNFGIPHFYWEFAKGNLNYRIDRTSFLNFMYEYQYDGRAVWMQKLNITNQELNNLFVFLEWNNLPENQYYQYDFFMDNCATRVRDCVGNCLNHRKAFTEQKSEDDCSFRDLLYSCTEETLLWWRFGIDLVLGARCDKKASNLEQMFSPLVMAQQFDTLTFSDTREPVAETPIQILIETRDPLHRSISPTISFWCLFVIILSFTVIAWKKNWKLRWLDIILFLLIGLISLLILFLWFFSSHYCTKINLNLLWCSPLFLYFAIRLRKSWKPLLIFQMILLFVVLIGFSWLPQRFNAAVIPIALTLLIRLIDKLRINPKE